MTHACVTLYWSSLPAPPSHYGAYMEFRSDPWWLTAIGVACVGGAVVWKWRKGP
jgi:hypothetical protein